MRVTMFTFAGLGLALALAAPVSAQVGPAVEEATVREQAAPVGLVLQPTAYTLPAGRWFIGGGLFQGTVAFRRSDEQFSLGAYRGIGNRVHVGGFWTAVQTDLPGGGEETEHFFGGAGQWQFISEGSGSRWTPAVALGGYAYGGDGTGGSAYLVASKNLMGTVRPGAIWLHGGLRWDTFDFDTPAIGASDDDDLAPFIGANLLVTPNLSLSAEWRDNHPWEADDVTAFGASLMFARNYIISAGVMNTGFDTNKLFISLGIVP